MFYDQTYPKHHLIIINIFVKHFLNFTVSYFELLSKTNLRPSFWIPVYLLVEKKIFYQNKAHQSVTN